MQARKQRRLLNCEVINAKKDIFKALNPINFLKNTQKKKGGGSWEKKSIIHDTVTCTGRNDRKNIVGMLYKRGIY